MVVNLTYTVKNMIINVMIVLLDYINWKVKLFVLLVQLMVVKNSQ